MRIRVGELRSIIREELGRATRSGLSEAGDRAAWLAAQKSFPPALQKQAIQAAMAFFTKGSANIAHTMEALRAKGVEYPPEFDAFEEAAKAASAAGDAALSAIGGRVKSVTRRTPEERAAALEAQAAALRGGKAASSVAPE